MKPMQVAITFDPMIIREMQRYKKPIITYIVGDNSIKTHWTTQIRTNGGVVYDDLNTSIKILDLMVSYSKTRGYF